MNTSML